MYVDILYCRWGYQHDRWTGWGWLGWPAPLHEYCSPEPASSTLLSHKRIINDTNQPTEHAVYIRIEMVEACVHERSTVITYLGFDWIKSRTAYYSNPLFLDIFFS